ncbi:toll/interleukin-1 receptor domain-containing protein [Nodosilinea sp. LEGE 07298]|uniref:toll/interleukin-1 receptor domain-containing protein n=1 Tax=Nodosilinea sp. LEGE 07298 TaxID=2777970 RepID=UPI001882B2B2|nr:toll/interleukin-1 receptor domain-containing protein [Nodosilinea sp. LEGE 07298]MBE9112012.1 toll/interleukin-1 receptor domain-containing protein [Nodosilinea sp. LEGE 07298]
MTSFTYQYDAFISYRRQEPDKAFARWLLKELKAAGYRVAFDEVDFSPRATFLNEMERCCHGSRLVLAVISPRYFESGNTDMEATITTVQGMSDRNNRFIPLIYEEVQRPTWMYSLVGVNFTDEDPLVPPLERLKAAMGEPLFGTAASDGTTAAPPPRPNPVSTNEKRPTRDLQARLKLMQKLSGLPNPQFEQIVFALQPPAGSMPGSSAPLGDRVAALLNWAEGTGGCGLEDVKSVLGAILTP